MKQTLPSPQVLKAATDAVVAYALHALAPEFLCWDKGVNMEVAEFVWNAGGRRLDPSVFRAPGGDLSALVRVLCRERRGVPAEIDDVLLLGLDVDHEHGEMFFTFELSWDKGETFTACKIAVEFSILNPVAWN